MSLIESYKFYNRNLGLLLTADKLLLAVSGGPDSVVLCKICDLLGYDFAIAHCNFKLRGKESDEDAAFVRKLAGQMDVPYFEKEFETATFAADNGLGIQDAARRLRYDWFRELMNESVNGFRWLLTAHHADDNVETLLMNFFKGTGIKGLQGIPYRNDYILRPLLFAFREEIMAFALEHSLFYRTDSSNESVKYTRNFFRLELIPSIEKVFPSVKKNLTANISRFSEVGILYEKSVADIKKKLLLRKNEDWFIPLKRLASTKALRSVTFEIIRDFNFSVQQTDEVLGMLNAQTGKYIDSATHRLLINRNWIVISPLKQQLAGFHLISAEAGSKQAGSLHVEVKIRNNDGHIHKDKKYAQLDMDLLKFPLLLRPWRPGDYFYPLGMRKKKKISRFLTDEKLSLQEKSETMVLESEGRIIWVAGWRMDDRFKVTSVTKTIFQLSL
jgi:tRNA(Ile)-lysidine synthase